MNHGFFRAPRAGDVDIACIEIVGRETGGSTGGVRAGADWWVDLSCTCAGDIIVLDIAIIRRREQRRSGFQIIARERFGHQNMAVIILNVGVTRIIDFARNAVGEFHKLILFLDLFILIDDKFSPAQAADKRAVAKILVLHLVPRIVQNLVIKIIQVDVLVERPPGSGCEGKNGPHRGR